MPEPTQPTAQAKKTAVTTRHTADPLTEEHVAAMRAPGLAAAEAKQVAVRATQPDPQAVERLAVVQAEQNQAAQADAKKQWAVENDERVRQKLVERARAEMARAAEARLAAEPEAAASPT